MGNHEAVALDRITRDSHGVGLNGAQQIAAHARSIVQLEVELAKLEVAQKSRAAAVGTALAAAGGIFGAYALLFALAAAAAALSLVLPVWASLLVVMGALGMIAAISIAVAIRLLKSSALPLPEQAIAEAKLTTQALQRV